MYIYKGEFLPTSISPNFKLFEERELTSLPPHPPYLNVQVIDAVVSENCETLEGT